MDDHLNNSPPPGDTRERIECNSGSLPLLATDDVARTDDDRDVRQLIDRVLRAEFGRLVDRVDGVNAISFPGCAFATVVAPFRVGTETMISVSSPAAAQADWSPGLSDYLLREN